MAARARNVYQVSSRVGEETGSKKTRGLFWIPVNVNFFFPFSSIWIIEQNCATGKHSRDSYVVLFWFPEQVKKKKGTKLVDMSHLFYPFGITFLKFYLYLFRRESSQLYTVHECRGQWRRERLSIEKQTFRFFCFSYSSHEREINIYIQTNFRWETPSRCIYVYRFIL